MRSLAPARYADEYVENRDSKADNLGHKWSLGALNRHLAASGEDVEAMWDKTLQVRDVATEMYRLEMYSAGYIRCKHLPF